MGRLPSVDGTPTSTITLRLPTWALQFYEDQARLMGLKSSREVLRNLAITNALTVGEVRSDVIAK